MQPKPEEKIGTRRPYTRLSISASHRQEDETDPNVVFFPTSQDGSAAECKVFTFYGVKMTPAHFFFQAKIKLRKEVDLMFLRFCHFFCR